MGLITRARILLSYATVLLLLLVSPVKADTDWLQYIASYGDLIVAFGPDPAVGEWHYLHYGQAEGRDLHKFDAGQYLANYPDLQAAYGTDTHAATIHYIVAGYREGRTYLPLTTSRPDIVVLIADDLGVGAIGPGRRLGFPTPAIDSIAARGINFVQGYGEPLCTPARVAILTGRFPFRYGIYRNSPRLPDDVPSLADRLKALGYSTEAVGKWHVGGHPLDHGFDHFLGYLKSEPPYFGDDPGNPLLRDRTPIPNPGYATDVLADEAVRFIQDGGGAPKLLYLAFTAPHPPMQAPADLIAAVPPTVPAHWRPFAAVTMGLDRAIQRVLAALRPNTLVLFAGDNGMGRGSNKPLRGGKGQLYEGAVRVPFMLMQPGRVPAGQVSTTPVSLLDIVPTAVRAAGGNLTPEMDGQDLLGPPAADRPIVFNDVRQAGAAIRNGQWMLLRDYDDRQFQLYDVTLDPSETRDLSALQPDIVRQLSDRLTGILQSP